MLFTIGIWLIGTVDSVVCREQVADAGVVSLHLLTSLCLVDGKGKKH